MAYEKGGAVPVDVAIPERKASVTPAEETIAIQLRMYHKTLVSLPCGADV